MFRNFKRRGALVGLVVTGAVAIGAQAADHLDPSTTFDQDPANAGDPADIADVFAWHTAEGNLVLALTFAGPVPTTEFSGDRDVLYGVHVDGADSDFLADADLWFRFGQDADGRWGIQAEGVPGTPGPVVGAVGSVTDLGGARLFAGVRDDPFFFDLVGFRSTVMSGDLMFGSLTDSNNVAPDAFAGANVSAIVVEFPVRGLPGDGPYRVWATTGRI
jgi:hypothetical protein